MAKSVARICGEVLMPLRSCIARWSMPLREAELGTWGADFVNMIRFDFCGVVEGKRIRSRAIAARHAREERPVRWVARRVVQRSCLIALRGGCLESPRHRAKRRMREQRCTLRLHQSALECTSRMVHRGAVGAVAHAFVLTIVAVGCKPRVLEIREDYEREVCACKHHDFACTDAALSKYHDALEHARAHWLERKLRNGEWQPHADAAKECARRVSTCSSDDPCGASWYCAMIRADTGLGFCARIVGDGEPCGGSEQTACIKGTWCRVPGLDQMSCDGPPCTPIGKCEKGAPPPAEAGHLVDIGDGANLMQLSAAGTSSPK